jgi:hypothetical protein
VQLLLEVPGVKIAGETGSWMLILNGPDQGMSLRGWGIGDWYKGERYFLVFSGGVGSWGGISSFGSEGESRRVGGIGGS